MQSQTYKWKRYWCSRSGKINLPDRGFVSDPEGKYGNIFNPDLVRFSSILSVPCLVFLGEPGIGKSSTIKVERSWFENRIKNENDEIIFLDLRSYGSEDRLVKKLFNCNKFNQWVNGSHNLHIFLDSLDECLLRIDTVATLLIDELSEYSDFLDRLYFRIACRTAVWPTVLEEGLNDIWTNDYNSNPNPVQVYELAPLLQVNVEEAAKTEGINPKLFIEEVITKNLAPLAIKPVTLKFLIKIFKRHNSSFPINQRLYDFYLEGCFCLCEEINQSRLSSQNNSKDLLDRDRRLVIASRIAAATVFGNRFAIWTGIEQDNVLDENVLLRDLCFGTEIINDNEVEVTRDVIKEVLDTGLFSSRGSSQISWAHQTYAEFLAAWYLIHCQVKLDTIRQLIIHPDDSEKRVIPQLSETVAWLSSMNSEVFSMVMKTDPDILLFSDTLIHDAECKSELIKYLLKLHDEEKLTDSFRIRQYENLNHPHIANQLQLYIDDDTKSTNARDIAIDIARACNIGTLGNSFVEIALNDREHKRLRINAALAVVQIADEDDKARLKSLVTREDLQGDRDDLKGLALKAVWPNHITVSEVFDSLTQPKSKVIGGRYQDFIARDLGEKLRKEDLSTALKWLGKQKTRRGLLYPFSLLSDKIMLKSWEHLEDLNILENFAKIAILRLSHYDDIIQSKNYDNDGYNKKTFKELIEIDCDKRRKLIQKIVDLIPSSENEPLWLNSYRTKIILNDDFVWLVECLRKSKTDNQRKVWSSILYQQFDWGTYNHAGLILEYSETIPSLKEQFSDYIDSINLDSERAEECKNSYFRTQEITNGRDELARPLLEPPPQKRILDLLDRFESGETEAWWRICREMTLLLTSTHYHASIKPDLMLLPGWKEANEKTRLRIIEAAKTYLIQEQTPTEQYLEYKGTYNDADLAVYKALLLVLKIEPDFINVIDGTRWKKWIPSILDYPGATDDSNIRFHEILVRKAYENASDEFIWVLHILIDYQNKQHGCIYIYSLINKLWDRKLADAMMNKIKDSSLAAKSIESLLEQLLRHNIEEARIFAESLISSSPPNTEQEREKVIVAAKALLIYAEDASWNLVWSVIQRDPKLGKDILESVSYFAEMDNRLEQRLKESTLADLYIFLSKHYPDVEQQNFSNSESIVTPLNLEAEENVVQQAKQLKGDEAYIREPDDTIRTWKNYIPQRIQERGTPEAFKALRKIIVELPEQREKIHWRLLETEKLVRRRSWKPFLPGEIIQLINTKEEPKVEIIPTIGIVTALPKEYAAFKVLLENTDEISFLGQGAGLRYLSGEVFTKQGEKHSVVLCYAGMGNNIAAIRASYLLNHFPELKSIIMVGIAGGIPHPEKPDDHVRLGDVVISNQKGVIQYDFVKETISDKENRHSPRPPSASLLEGVGLLEAEALLGNKPWLKFIERAILPAGNQRPSNDTDVLVSSTDPNIIIEHPQDPKRRESEPRIFTGPIASANDLLKNPITRDRLRDRFGVKAVEMEASG